MKVAEVVGSRIASERKRLGMTQAELGHELRPFLGAPWSRQAVSNAEVGRRDFTAAELLALSQVLQTPVGTLFNPEDPLESVEFPSGADLEAIGMAIPRLSNEDRRVLVDVFSTFVDQLSASADTWQALRDKLRAWSSSEAEEGDVHQEAPAARLTQRESEILGLISASVPTSEIASRLGRSPKEVKADIERILEKLGGAVTHELTVTTKQVMEGEPR